jgi:predicted nucleic acid-binding protein
MSVYVETSAVAAWLLDEPSGWMALDAVREADTVVTSELTLVECDRLLRRRVASGEMGAERADLLRTEFAAASAAWGIVPVGSDIAVRARDSYPDDRIRALDAIHLATALTTRSSVADLAIVSLDGRIRRNAEALGIPVLPV